MTTSITVPLARDSTRNKWATAAGLAVALACLLAPPPLRAAEAHHARQQHAQRHAPRQQAYRHGNYRRGGGYYSGYPGYVYGAPPLVYGPSVVPGINLFLPL